MMNLPRARSSAARSQRPGRVDAAQDAGVDADQGEPIGLDLEEGGALPPALHAVLAGAGAAASSIMPSMRRFGRGGEARSALVRAQRGARGLRLEEVGREGLQGVVPVVVSRDRVDRLPNPLKGR